MRGDDLTGSGAASDWRLILAGRFLWPYSEPGFSTLVGGGTSSAARSKVRRPCTTR